MHSCPECRKRQVVLYAAATTMVAMGGTGLLAAREHATELKSWSARLGSVTAQKDAAERQGASLGDELARALSRNGKMKIACDDLRTDIERHRTMISRLKAENTGVRRSNHALAAQVVKSQAASRRLSVRVAEANDRLVRLDKQIAAERVVSARQVAIAQASGEATARQLASVRAELAEHTRKLAMLRPIEPPTEARAVRARMGTASYTEPSMAEPFYTPPVSGDETSGGTARFLVTVGSDCRTSGVSLIQSSGSAERDAALRKNLEGFLWRTPSGENPTEATKVKVTVMEDRSIRVHRI